jgi:hypothetical protein
MTKKDTSSPLAIVPAVLGLIGAAAAVLLALLTKSLICHGDSDTSCRTGLMNIQLLVALAGLIPLVAMLRASIQRKTMLAFGLFFIAILIYAAWAVLNDAAVHGWDNLKIF